jgi:hypothetical protein
MEQTAQRNKSADGKGGEWVPAGLSIRSVGTMDQIRATLCAGQALTFNVSPLQHAHGSHALDRGKLEMQNSQKAGAERRILFMYTRNGTRQEAGATSLPRAAAK